MKNILLILSIILILSSCKENKPKIPQIILFGKIENYNDTVITLRLDDFKHKIVLNIDGSFSDTIYHLKEAYYTLSTNNEQTKIYLKNGDNISINIDASDFNNNIKYSGIGANENNFLAQQILHSGDFNYWHLCKFSEDSFTNKLDSLTAFKNETLENYIQTVPELNKNFYELEKTNNQYFSAYVKENYASAHQYYNKLENFEPSKDFYLYRKELSLENKSGLKTQFYPNYVEAYISNKIVENDTSEYAFEAVRTINRELQDMDVKKEFIYRSAKSNISNVKNIEEYWAIISYMVTDKEKIKELEKKYTALQSIQKGNTSPMTSFTNFEDKNFNLKDFKGKYIYIDVWAQWCGPCKREAPFFKEIEEKYANKDIHFIKLSLDQDQEAWKNYIAENKATENSFIVAEHFDSDFAKAYLINSIPRFILLDKDFKILDANAPRPSDDKLTEILDQLL